MRYLIPVLIGLTFVVGLLTGTGRETHDVIVEVNGRPLPVRGEVRYGQAYVDALSLARALGLRPVYFPDKPLRGVWLQNERERRFVHLHTGQADCHVGGETVQLNYPTLYLHRGSNTPMAPVRFVAETFGARVEERPVVANGRLVIVTPAAKS